MKIIELLNKIASGEEVPKRIKYRDKIFVYDKNNQCYIVENYNEYNDLLMELSNHKGTELLYEVEILEEEKKIPEKLYETSNIGDFTITYPSNKELMEKINEIIDYFKSKGE